MYGFKNYISINNIMMNNEISKIHMYVTLLSFYYKVNTFLYTW